MAETGRVSSTSVQVSSAATEAPRRHLSERQARTVDGLVDAALGELRAVGYSDLTVRNVAKRAGVAPATAYTYFASKEHLVAEVYWRRFVAQPEVPAVGRGDDDTGSANGSAPADISPVELVDRVVDALSAFALVVADEAELSTACTVAVLAEDPDVKDLRERIGTELHRRLVVALGPDADAAIIRTLQFATAGALLQVGTGHLGYDALPRLLREIATTVLGGPRP